MYSLTQEDRDRLDNNFKYHPPTVDQSVRYEQIRLQAKVMATAILELCPPSRERSLALTQLEDAIMWANASIARNEKQETENK